MPVAGNEFKWMLPGERRVASWGARRAKMVQGDSRQLVSGAYIILAALWALVGSTVTLVGALLDLLGGSSSPVIFGVGAMFLSISFFRQVQSRRSRERTHAD